ncbi:MAG: hypothetical protein JW716_00925 [Candidatus Aenigmarchaeota archaeon]|nr:hypothetical protein [Candidatus Aenigmarchaeota archaeon]
MSRRLPFSDYSKTIAVLSFCRPNELDYLSSAIPENVREYGHNTKDWSLLVIDTSPEEYKQQNLRSLSGKGKDMDIFYFGRDKFSELAGRYGEQNFRRMFTGHGAADARNLGFLITPDKTMVTLDDDMRLTSSVLHEKQQLPGPSFLSTGRFILPERFGKESYKSSFDLVTATTSALGKRVKEMGIPAELQGIVLGNRDASIDELMGGDNPTNGFNGNGHAYCFIQPGYINPDSRVLMQGVSAITGNTDCHATASIRGLAKASNENGNFGYGNMFVHYAVHDGNPGKIAVASRWKESTLAAAGVLNERCVPVFLLSRNEDAAYRYIIGENNPVAIYNIAVDHNRSHDGRPPLSLIYLREYLGAKVCKRFHEAMRPDGSIDTGRVEPLHESDKKSLYRSAKETSAILDTISSNGNANTELGAYASRLIKDIASFIGVPETERRDFWNADTFKGAVYKKADEFLGTVMSDTRVLNDNWEGMVADIRKNGVHVQRIE